MATVQSYRAMALNPETVTATIKFTGDADVDANGFTVNTNPGNIVSTVAKGSSEGDITITLAEKWVGLDNCLCSCSIDDTIVTVDSETVSSTKLIKLATITAGSAADADSGVIRVTLILRLQ